MELLFLNHVLTKYKLMKKVIFYYLDVILYYFLLLIFLSLGDGIFDTLTNDEIFMKIWSYKKKGEVHNDIRTLCGKITDGIIKYSMEKKSADNVSIIFIAFKNFENKMKVQKKILLKINWSKSTKSIKKRKSQK